VGAGPNYGCERRGARAPDCRRAARSVRGRGPLRRSAGRSRGYSPPRPREKDRPAGGERPIEVVDRHLIDRLAPHFAKCGDKQWSWRSRHGWARARLFEAIAATTGSRRAIMCRIRRLLRRLRRPRPRALRFLGDPPGDPTVCFPSTAYFVWVRISARRVTRAASGAADRIPPSHRPRRLGLDSDSCPARSTSLGA
jgi:hypothetical protein